MTNRKMTNQQFIANIMMYSRRGNLIQSFVLCGLQKYSESVIKAHEKGQLEGSIFGFISAEAWADCAKEFLEKIAEHYGNSETQNKNTGEKNVIS